MFVTLRIVFRLHSSTPGRARPRGGARRRHQRLPPGYEFYHYLLFIELYTHVLVYDLIEETAFC